MKKQAKDIILLPLWAQVCLPLLLTLLCGGILLIASIRPFALVQTYLCVAFMDGSGTAPTTDGTAGLNIVETDINTDDTRETIADGDVVVPAYGTQNAVLRCDAADLYVPVYWGGGTELLAKGACQSTASAVIGSEGNSVISAHVNTFFHDLNQVTPGDTVVLYTTYGRFTYEVTEEISFSASNKSYLAQTDTDQLTLYTCEMQLLGSSDTRIGVICTLQQREFYPVSEGETP